MEGGLRVWGIPAWSDNYFWLLQDEATGQAAVVDPGAAAPVLALLDRLKRLGGSSPQLAFILNTHHHWDHIGGNAELKSHFQELRIYAPIGDQGRNRTATHWVSEDQNIPRSVSPQTIISHGVLLGQTSFQVLDVPGHTSGHCAWYAAGASALFCGDTLFSLGCGRLETPAARMWHSLVKLRTLPESTRVFCAHEYTLTNALFALSLEPDNKGLQAECRRLAAQQDRGTPTIPSHLGYEKAHNPFLRADSPFFMAYFEASRPEESFKAMRQAKDRFRP